MNHDYHFNNNVSFGENTKEFLIVHHTGVVGDGNIKALAGLTGRNVSVHYLIRKNGKVFQFVDEGKIAWHCGKSKREDRTMMNRYSIGIEVESDGKSFTQDQKVTFEILSKEIVKRNNIPKDHILRHADISGFHGKWDVGEAFYYPFSWKEYIDFTFSNITMDKWELLEASKKLRSSLYDLDTMIEKMIESEDLKGLLKEEKNLLHSTNDLIRDKENKYNS